MADFDHTLEFSSAQEKPSHTINLIVQNVCASTPPGVGSLAHSVISGQYNPCVIFQGKWLRKFGFEIGDPIRVVAEPSLLCVIPSTSYIEASTMVEIVPGKLVSHVDFKEEVDCIKAEKDCRFDAKGGGKENGRDVGQRGDKDAGKDSGEYSHKDTAKSEDISDVLTGVKRELDYD